MPRILPARFPKILLVTLLCGWWLLPANAQAQCASPAGTAGQIVYNSTNKLFQFCNDTSWVRMTMPGSGSGGCSNPAVAEGQIVFNADQSMLQGCTGNVWRTVTPAGGASIRHWKEFAVGIYHGCGIKFDGSLWCVGSNGWGQLGIGPDYETKYTAVPIAVGQTWKAISVSTTASCAIRSDDTLWCWGNNFGGQLGVGTDSDNRDVPEQVSGGGTWKAVSTSADATCGIKSDDTLWCWGDDTNGKLGNGASGNTTVPGAVSGGGSWIDVSRGDEFTCGIKSDNSMYCWGRDNLGQLGNGAVTGDQQTPYQVTGTWKNVESGSYSSCAIQSDDTIRCWGSDIYGQLGNGATGSTTSPGAITGGGTWKSVTVGGTTGCGIKSDDTLYCWGDDAEGQLGNGASGSSTSPVIVSGGWTWQFARAGDRSVCGINMKGRLLCWGYNSYSQLGQGNRFSDFSAPQPVSGNSQWLHITTGDEFSCGIKTDGTGWCMGTDSDGTLGNGAVSGSQHYPYAIAGGGTWKSMTGGDYHTCGIKSDDTGWCWGANWGDGMTGDGTTNGAPAPVSLDDGGATWKQIGTGSFHACGIKSDDTAWCWGAGYSGEIGNGSTNAELSPVAVSGGYTWKKIDGGYGFTCGIRSDDTMWCWGYNGNGELGDGTFTDSSVPVPVSGGHTWKEISAGDDQACGIRMDDTVWCWGDDSEGQLGNGPGITGAQGAPVQISGGGSWKFINSRDGMTCGIQLDGSGWCWGSDTNGQLGNGPAVTANQDVPYQIHGGGNWTSISAGSWGFACGINKSQAMCWGSPWTGSFGIGNTTYPDDIITPTPIICDSPEGRAGDIVYNTDANALQFCDGAVWVTMGQ